MTEAILKEAQSKIDKAIEVAKEDFATIRTGRANASMFNKISADYYGTQTPLNQMATFQTPEARMIIITPFDKSAIQAIEKIRKERPGSIQSDVQELAISYYEKYVRN